MSIYNYQAFDPAGKAQSGTVTADTIEEANEQIFARQLTPVEVRFTKKGDGGSGWTDFQSKYMPVPTRELIVFTKQLVTMIRVGIPLIQALIILEEQTEQPRLRRLAGEIKNDVEGGASLSAAMAKHSKVFSPLYTSMVEAGETSGTLPEVLDRLLYLIEHEAMIKAEIKAATRYPVMVMIALAVAFLIMLGFVIPRFVGFFAGAGLELPLPTKMCITLSNFLVSFGPWLALAAIGAFFGLRYYVSTEQGRYYRDFALLRTPLIGPVLNKAAMSRFASIFAILQSSGVLVLDALRILTTTVGNAAIAVELIKVRDLLEEGRGISAPLRSSKYFPPMLVNMVAIGEESGRLDEMLREVSAHYDVEVRLTMKKMSDSIGPILIISLTAIVGFFALAIYMPMWDLTQMASSRAK